MEVYFPVLEISQVGLEVWCFETLPDALYSRESGWNKCMTVSAMTEKLVLPLLLLTSKFIQNETGCGQGNLRVMGSNPA